MTLLKRLVVSMVLLFILVVFGLFAFNFYRQTTSGDYPEAKPPVIYERSNRPSRA